jgi:hypothetical protein
MAEVDAPLFSFNARGSLGKALVYFGWKGMNVVRSYVKPANPQTDDQQTQRGLFTDAVDDYHTVALDADDLEAWKRYAGVKEKPQSGFNAFVADHIAIAAAGQTPNMGWDGSLTDATGGKFDATIEEGGSADAADLEWGYTPTSLIHTDALAEVANVWSVSDVVAAANAWVYGRFVIKDGGLVVGRTGIFKVKVS